MTELDPSVGPAEAGLDQRGREWYRQFAEELHAIKVQEAKVIRAKSWLLLGVIYTADVLKTRWPELEPYVVEDTSAARIYVASVVHGRFLAYEQILHTWIADPWHRVNRRRAKIEYQDLLKLWPDEHAAYVMEHGDWRPA